MSQRPFRLIHASDFHLEQPPHGLAEVPDHLRDALLEAPYRAAAKVFDLAIAEGAEFLVLAGDILDPELTGPRGPLFLIEQFGRLAERQINVYWAGSSLDQPAAWPAGLRLPDNVHCFATGGPEELIVDRAGEPLARLLGLSQARRRKLRPADFGSASDDLFSLVVAHAVADRDALATRGIRYWALGGSHTRATTQHPASLVHYSGTHQGRGPQEPGPHGCTLVEIDAGARARVTFLPCDVLRFVSESIAVEATTTRDQLRQTLDDRLRELIARHPVATLLIDWTVRGVGPLLWRLRRGALAAELLEDLRRQSGVESPQAWSLRLSAEADLPAVDAAAEATLLGDFLGAMQSRLAAAGEPLSLEKYLNARHVTTAIADAVSLADAGVRARVLRGASVLGRDLLSGEDQA